MDKITQSEFARRAGMSRQAVSNAIKRGTIKKSGLKIDIDDPMNRLYLAESRAGRTQKHTPHAQLTDKKLPIPGEDDLTVQDQLTLNQMKTIEDIRQKRVKTDKDRGVLIPRETVKKLFSRLYQIDVNQWRTLGMNVAPEVAAVIGSDKSGDILKINEIIEDEVFKILKQVKKEIKEYVE